MSEELSEELSQRRDSHGVHDHEILRSLARIEDKLNRLLSNARVTNERIAEMSVELDQLAAEITASTDVQAGAMLLLTKLHDMLAAAQTDPVKLKELTTFLATKKAELAAAILANTPADPANPAMRAKKS